MQVRDATELLSKSADIVLAYIRENEMIISYECDFNWLLVAEIATSRSLTIYSDDRMSALSWAITSVIIYDRLEATVGPQELQFFGLSAAEVRSNMILSLGPMPGHVVLDPGNIEDWFFRRLGMNLDEAREFTRRWDDLSADETFRLLDLRSRYEAIKMLHAKGLFQHTQELSEWQTVLSGLPGG